MEIYPITIPGGSDGYIQYNNGGIFGGDSTFTLNDSTKMVTASGLTLNGSQTYGIDLSGGTWSTGVLNYDQPFDIFSSGTRCMYFDDTNSIVVFGMGDAGNIDSITTGVQITAIGSKVLRDVTTGNNLIGIGTLAAAACVGGSNSIAIGASSLQNSVTPVNIIAIGGLSLTGAVNYSRDVAVGTNAAKYAGTGGVGGYDITAVGDSAGLGVNSSSSYYETCLFGSKAGYGLTTGGKRDVLLGFKAGYNQTTLNDILIIDNRDRGSAANEITQCLIYGVMSATVSSQSVNINGDLNVRHHFAGIPDEITATDAGVAASLDTLNTEVTTNGDNDLDNVTLANGTSGQVKNIYCVVEGAAGDSWKITPATMVGGSQITFLTSGMGCTLVYADNEGWCVVANNGGTIT